MKAKLKQTSWTNRFILLSLLILAVSNPWSVGYIEYSLEVLRRWSEEYSMYIFASGLIMLVTVNIVMMWRSRQKVNVSDKHYSQKTKNKNYKSSKLALLED